MSIAKYLEGESGQRAGSGILILILYKDRTKFVIRITFYNVDSKACNHIYYAFMFVLGFKINFKWKCKHCEFEQI